QGINKLNRFTATINTPKSTKFKLIYAGGLFKQFREPFELYKALKNLQKEVELDIFGNISQELLPYNAENIHYRGLVNNPELTNEYISSDCIVFIDNDNGFQVPGKILEIQEMNKPILILQH
ncbi:hypothetical protein ACFLTU_10810, partial [Bacteroidota bacterium]